MFKFMDNIDSNVKVDINEDSEYIDKSNDLLSKIDKGFEDGLDILTLSNEFSNLIAGIESYETKLPVYVKAYSMVADSVDKLTDYQAGIEDNFNMDETVENVLFVSKTLNITVEEIDYGLLDDDKDDKKNTNIIIKILKKIFNFIVGFIKGIVKGIIKIIGIFFKFIKKILGFGDPATVVTKKLEEVEKEIDNSSTSSFGGGGGFSGFGGNTFQNANNRYRNNSNNGNNNNSNNNSNNSNNSNNNNGNNSNNNNSNNNNNNNGNNSNNNNSNNGNNNNGNNNTNNDNTSSSRSGEILDEELENNEDARNAKENVENEEQSEYQNLTLSDEQLQRLEEIGKELQEEYPLAILLTNQIFDFDKDNDLNLFNVLSILYCLTSAVAKSNISCTANSGNLTVERHVNELIDSVKDISNIMAEFKKYEKDKNDDPMTPAPQSYLSSTMWVRLDSLINKTYYIYGDGDTNERSVISSIRRFMDSISSNLVNVNQDFEFNLSKIKKKFTEQEFNDIDLADIIRTILKEKLGDTFYDGFTDYIPTNTAGHDVSNDLKGEINASIVNSGYNYFKAAVLTFDRKEINILVHLTNVDSTVNINRALPANLGNNMHGAVNSKPAIADVNDFFVSRLPKIAEDVKGKFVTIKLNVTRDDLINKFNIHTVKPVLSNALLTKTSVVKLTGLTAVLAGDLKSTASDLESCLKKTESEVSNLEKVIKDLEKDFDDFLSHLSANKKFADKQKSIKLTFRDQAKYVDGRKSSLGHAIDDKMKTVTNVKKSMVKIAGTIQNAATDIITIYKSVVISNLTVVKTLSTDTVISSYVADLLDFYKTTDGVGG